MPTSRDKIPNLPLSGPELSTWVVAMLCDELQKREVPAEIAENIAERMQRAFANDFLFRVGTSYPAVEVELKFRLHWRGDGYFYSVEPEFKLSNPLAPKHTVRIPTNTPPMAERDGTKVEAFTLTALAANPNLIRVRYRISILQMVPEDPMPGELYKRFRTVEIEYDPAEFPEPDPATVFDETAAVSAEWGVKQEEVMPTDGFMVRETKSTVTGAGAQEGGDAPASTEHKGRRRKGWNKQ